MKISSILAFLLMALFSVSLPACNHKEEEPHEGGQKIIVTTPDVKDVVVTHRYVCQIHSKRHIEVRALEEGYLEEIPVKEGQAVKQNEVLFRVLPVIYQARLNAELAEANYAQLKLNNTKRLYDTNVVSIQEVALFEAELAKAKARAAQARAEMNFTEVKASFDGIVDRQMEQQGSLVKKDAILTTLSDNTLMWVYFNVPEAIYLNYEAKQGKSHDISRLKLVNSKIELLLANGTKFDQPGGDTVTVEAAFNNKTGNIPFRADFPNPDRILRHGQTGTILIHEHVPNAIVIPQRATFEFLDKQYVWVVGEDEVVHRRLITIAHELEDEFVVRTGLEAKDKIIVEGVRQVHENDKIEYEFRKPEEVLAHQKSPAE